MDSTLLGAVITAAAAIVAALIAKSWKHGRRRRSPGETPREPQPPRSSRSSHKLQIKYEYNDVGCPVGAKAYLDGHWLIGEAQMASLNKGKDMQLEETHYSLSGDGAVAYQGHVWFGIPGGFKLRESVKRGHKEIDIFKTWPI